MWVFARVCVSECVFLFNMDTNHSIIPADEDGSVFSPATAEACEAWVTHVMLYSEQFKNPRLYWRQSGWME